MNRNQCDLTDGHTMVSKAEQRISIEAWHCKPRIHVPRCASHKRKKASLCGGTARPCNQSLDDKASRSGGHNVFARVRTAVYKEGNLHYGIEPHKCGRMASVCHTEHHTTLRRCGKACCVSIGAPRCTTDLQARSRSDARQNGTERDICGRTPVLPHMACCKRAERSHKSPEAPPAPRHKRKTVAHAARFGREDTYQGDKSPRKYAIHNSAASGRPASTDAPRDSSGCSQGSKRRHTYGCHMFSSCGTLGYSALRSSQSKRHCGAIARTGNRA